MTWHLGEGWGGKGAWAWQLSRKKTNTRNVVLNDLVHGRLSKKEMHWSKHGPSVKAILRK
jgi:hypothetical protein